MNAIRGFVEKNFALFLLIGGVIGFFVPTVGPMADEIVIVLTALMIFFSCADIQKKEFLDVDIFNIGIFTLLRYAVFPLALFYVAHPFFPEFSTGILLLALMPAGVVVAALCSMSKANVVIGLSLTLITSLLAPFLIPAVFSFLGQSVTVNIWELFLTLLFVIFVPIIIYFGIFDKIKKTRNFIQENNKFSTIIFLSIILAIVFSSQKQEFLNNIDIITIGLIVMSVLFALFYGFGFIYSLFVSEEQKIPFIFASGAMNNALAIGIAFAHFDAMTSLFLVLSEVIWSIYVAGSQYYFSRRKI